jgi:hypothetical protein
MARLTTGKRMRGQSGKLSSRELPSKRCGADSKASPTVDPAKKLAGISRRLGIRKIEREEKASLMG